MIQKGYRNILIRGNFNIPVLVTRQVKWAKIRRKMIEIIKRVDHKEYTFKILNIGLCALQMNAGLDPLALAG